jgi:hypothetical protein
MANLDAPNGFTPSYHRAGGTIRYEGGFKIADGLAADIFSGDLVIIDAAADDTHITVGAAASTRLLGVFAGCQYTAANGDVVWSNQWASGTATKGGVAAEAFVYTDHNIVYTAQLDGIITLDEVFGYADSIQTVAGNAATGISGMEVNATSAAATILQLKLLGFAAAPDGIYLSDPTTANAGVNVAIAEGEYYVWDA